MYSGSGRWPVSNDNRGVLPVEDNPGRGGRRSGREAQALVVGTRETSADGHLAGAVPAAAMSERRMPPRSILAAGLVLAAVLLAWQLGVHQGGARPEPDSSSTATATQGVNQQMARLLEERDMARAEVAALQLRLSDATRLSADERAELELYRRIENPQTPSGLGVNDVHYTAGSEEGDGVLDVTLVQSRGRDRVAGELRVSLLQDGEPVQVVDTWPDGSALSFDLRFFETLKVPLNLAGSGEPDAVLVDVLPDGDRHTDVSVQRAWNLVAQ